MAIKLTDLQLIYGLAGAREKFEELTIHLIRSERPEAERIRIVRGDGGIDSHVGCLADPSGVDVYQIKFFSDAIGDSQKSQIRESFNRVRGNNNFRTKTWTLCLPIDMSLEEKKWFDEWKESQKDYGIEIQPVWSAVHLEGLLYLEKNSHLREQFFKQDNQQINAVEKRLLRIEFQQESLHPLRYLLLVIDLQSPTNPLGLGHFRALLTLRRDGPNQDITLCVGGRDAYITQVSSGVERQLFGHKLLNWVEEPTHILQQTQLSFAEPEVAQIVLEVDLRCLPAFSMIRELAECDTWVYLTDPLWTQTSRVSIVAGEYILATFGRDQLAALNGNPTVQWPEPLTESESAVEWRPLLPRGQDYPRYEREGESPDWFPFNLYARWLFDLNLSTPPRIQSHQATA